jgi:hypothetical protein
MYKRDSQAYVTHGHMGENMLDRLPDYRPSSLLNAQSQRQVEHLLFVCVLIHKDLRIIVGIVVDPRSLILRHVNAAMCSIVCTYISA